MTIEENKLTEDEIEVNRLKKEYKEKKLPQLEEVAQREPNNVRIHKRLVDDYSMLDMYDKAIEECEKVIEIGECDLIGEKARRLGEHGAEEIRIESTGEGSPFTDTYIKKIDNILYYWFCLKKKKLTPSGVEKEKIKIFERLLKKRPNHPGLHEHLAEAYEEALQEYKRYYELCPGYLQGTIKITNLRLQGFIFYKNGEYDKAIKEWEKIMNSEFRDAWWAKGKKIEEYMKKACERLKSNN